MDTLRNPVWHSLSTDHAALARGGPLAKRYLPEVAPFVAVVDDSSPAAAELASIVSPGERVYLVGVAPPFDSDWQVLHHSSILQMICSRPAHLPAPRDVTTTALTCDNAPEMLALMGLVYPGFFRQRTCEMGNYLGISVNDQLVAMAGERMRFGDYQEISAVCTHPDFVGRGYAGYLVTRLVDTILERQLIPFLHVARENERAHALYERLGFAEYATVSLWHVERRETA